MFVLWAVLVTIAFVGLDLIYIKTFQLEGYRQENYFFKAISFDFAFGKKTPLKFTNRVKRLIFCDFLIKFAVFLLFFGLISNFWINFVLCLFLLVLSPFFVMLSFYATLPIEAYVKNSFIKKAQKKLRASSCKTIAITGSYGKTSTKNILYQILKHQFAVCVSPKSYNTPMGVCRTILENLQTDDDFLILEFGARRPGDIAELANMVGVDYGILTPIGGCHLETFGSLQKIEDTKFELCNAVKDVVVFNGKSKSTKKLYSRFKRKKILVCTQGSFAYAKNIKSGSNGSQWTMILDGQNIQCQSKLLGGSAIENITVAAAMAYLLGENVKNIQEAISSLQPSPHRLQLINGAVANVIDDSYNSNFDGFKEALHVLKSFGGKKIVVSPGIVELGDAQYDVNKTVATEVAKVADEFVICNQTNKTALFDGALDGGMEKEHIHFANTRAQQTEILKTLISVGDTVLFENDLPDNIR